MTLKLVYSKPPAPPERIRLAWLEDSSLVEDKSKREVDSTPVYGIGCYSVARYFKDSKGKEYINVSIIDSDLNVIKEII